MSVSTGVLREAFSYVRIEGGPGNLVILPGMALDNGTPGGLVARGYAAAFRRFTEQHTVYVLQRRRGLPEGASTEVVADDYAALIEAELGPAPVLGLSTGGLIAQHLGLRRPDLVPRLALAVTGTRLGPEGRAICRRWQQLAAAGDWRALRGALAAVVVDGRVAQALARSLGGLAGRPPEPVDAGDFATIVEAVLRHDTGDAIAGLTMPTLVLAGDRDPFFPEPILAETAAAPAAELRLVPGAGHGLPKQHARRFGAEVAAFLTPA